MCYDFCIMSYSQRNKFENRFLNDINIMGYKVGYT